MTNRRIESPHLSDIEFAPAGSKKVKIPISGGVIIGGDTDDYNNIRLHKASKDHLQIISGDDTTPEGSYAPVSNFVLGYVPIGSIISWIGGYFNVSESYIDVLGSTITEANAYLNDTGWYVCDGASVNDNRSPVFNGSGRHLPSLTDNRFLIGSNTIGEKGGSNVLTDHTHTTSLTAVGQGGGSHDHTYSLTAAGQTLDTTNINSGDQSANHTHSQSSHNHTQDFHSHTAWTDTPEHQHISPSIAHGNVSGAGPWGTTYASLPQSAWGQYIATPNPTNPANVMNDTWYATTHSHGVGINNTTATNNAATPPALGSNSVSHNHTTDISHTHISSSVSGVIDSTAHTHDSSIILGAVGSDNAASLTENRPKYLSCLYIMRIF